MPTIPAGRLQLSEQATNQYVTMSKLSRSIELDHTLRGLIDIRASQINCCAFCLDMHWKDARAAGESEERLSMVPAWRESPLFDERERAALGLTEAMTLIADGQVPDDVWDEAAAQFDQSELAQVIFAIATINTWNRLSITTRAEPGHYQPGMFG